MLREKVAPQRQHKSCRAAGPLGHGALLRRDDPTRLHFAWGAAAAATSVAATAVHAVPVAVAATHVHVDGKSAAPTTLIDRVGVLKRELGLSGDTVHVLVHQAATQLGIAAEGRTLHDLAAACMQALGHA